MSTPSILDAIQQNLGPDTVKQISATLGLDPGTTSKAISMALPVLLGGLNHNVSTPQGATSLNDALGSHDGSILDNLGGLFQNPAAAAGAAILGHIFGKKQSPVEDGVARASGISAAQVSQLLIMLAPIVMGVLGRMKQQHGLGADQIPQVLNQGATAAQADNPIIAGLTSILSGGQGSGTAGEIAQAGSAILGNLFGKKS